MSDQDRDERGLASVPPPSASDRRIASRHHAFFPAEVDVGNGVRRTALVRDLSVTGVMMLTRAKVKIGDDVTLFLYLTGDPEKAREVQGRVVRDERRSFEVMDVWPYAVGVQFAEPFPENEVDAVKELAEKQASIGATKSD